MTRRISTLILVITIMATANVFATTRVDPADGDKKQTTAAAEDKDKKDWKAILSTDNRKPFDPESRKSTLADHQAQKKAGKKFSTTSKVLIGVGIAAAVLAIVVVAARDSVKDNLLR